MFRYLLNIARVQNCPNITILNSFWSLSFCISVILSFVFFVILSFCLFVFFFCRDITLIKYLKVPLCVQILKWQSPPPPRVGIELKSIKKEVAKEQTFNHVNTFPIKEGKYKDCPSTWITATAKHLMVSFNSVCRFLVESKWVVKGCVPFPVIFWE